MKYIVIVIVMVFMSMQAVMLNAQLSTSEEVAQAKKAELNNTEWAVEVTPLGAKGKIQAESDIVSFADGKFISRNLEAAGFTAANFSVRVEEDGTAVWETMQTTENGDVTSWRGTIMQGIMRGNISKRDSRGRTSDFSFSGVRR
ncbi:MAG: hypothetical protein V1893_03670 [Candidatus Omnitrophota bacterium]